ncbi:1,4-alpha-glucan branching protein GlgB [Tepidiforma sp.]|uniref:1,4-alpha-glucan branching protein GlgB n=1 Tax=Tepidiforma sp. TaxID=2682230 RepID=UPI002ADDC624|nr:1,4-alpha-glucan branching protein GlgB [Tepidiforma sp.]
MSGSRFGEQDLYLFNEGSHARLYRLMGAHPGTAEGQEGFWFAMWAPNASAVSVAGDFNGWDPEAHPLRCLGSSGAWEGFVPGVKPGDRYKFVLRNRETGEVLWKADPYAFRSEAAPGTASVAWTLEYRWGDAEWMARRPEVNRHDRPIAIYEVHLGSWRRGPGGEMRGYRELAPELAAYAAEHGFTHVELLPVMEHPFYGSWGYQTTGYFAASSRWGTPQDLMFLIDTLHQAGVGVILDWVPSHFASDEWALWRFDGTHLYEHADPRRGYHPDWGSLVFNYGRHEVRSFLLSSAMFWLDVFHADGLRVDAVASMLYLDYSRKPGEWEPNVFGGREDLDAITFLRRLNETVYGLEPGVQTYAEESTAWPMVSRPTWMGGLGFGMKWDMGWMHDTLLYLQKDPVHRKYHHNLLTFRALYGFTENFVLALSHDEVVHGKGSLLAKMPGDDWQKFANLRLLLAYQWTLPGKKLLFMGQEFGQWSEWNHEAGLEWHLAEFERHAGLARLVGDLNRLYRGLPALHETDHDPAGFEWVDCDDAEQSTLVYLRRPRDGRTTAVVALNFTPVPRVSHTIGLPRAGTWREVLNTDGREYGGSGMGNLGAVEADQQPWRGWPASARVVLPPLGAVVLVHDGEG